MVQRVQGTRESSLLGSELALGDTWHITYISIVIPRGGFRWGLGVSWGRMRWKSRRCATVVGVSCIAKSNKIMKMMNLLRRVHYNERQCIKPTLGMMGYYTEFLWYVDDVCYLCSFFFLMEIHLLFFFFLLHMIEVEVTRSHLGAINFTHQHVWGSGRKLKNLYETHMGTSGPELNLWSHWGSMAAKCPIIWNVLLQMKVSRHDDLLCMLIVLCIPNRAC